LVYPMDRAAYGRLCRLLSLGKQRAGKAKCRLDWSDLVALSEGLIAVLVPNDADEVCALNLGQLYESFGDRAYMALTLHRRPNDALRLHELSNLAAQARVPTVVTNDVLFHIPARRILQDVVTCIRHNVTIDELGFRRERHADRYLKSPDEMGRLFDRHRGALARTIEIVQRCRFSLNELAYQYPEEPTIPAMTIHPALHLPPTSPVCSPFFVFFTVPATPHIYPLSLHDALPIPLPASLITSRSMSSVFAVSGMPIATSNRRTRLDACLIPIAGRLLARSQA